MSEETNKTSEDKNDTIAFIIGGIFILGLVFATYNYFNHKGATTLEGGNGKQGKKLSLDALKETLSANTEEDEKNAAENNNGTQETENGDVKGDTTEVSWTANDYKEGDIATGNYEVKSGDTLWEIAEAVYGNGTMWTKIRDANSGKIGYLPNGQQSLIYTGQTLNIPAN